MTANVGSADRIVRVVLGLCIASLGLVLHGHARLFALFAIIPFATAAFSFCPLYTLLALNSCKRA